jgi:hypothetical protein
VVLAVEMVVARMVLRVLLRVVPMKIMTFFKTVTRWCRW